MRQVQEQKRFLQVSKALNVRSLMDESNESTTFGAIEQLRTGNTDCQYSEPLFTRLKVVRTTTLQEVY